MLAKEQKAQIQPAFMWDRRPNEPPKAWELFELYRDMGTARSPGAVARDFGVSAHYVSQMLKKWDWVLRARAWDARLAAIKQEAYEDEARKMGARHARLGMAMQSIGETRLGEIAASDEIRGSLTPRDTVQLIKEGAELERTARGPDVDKRDGGNITFNLFMGGMPKWAPPGLPVQVRDAIEGQGTVVDASEEPRGDNT